MGDSHCHLRSSSRFAGCARGAARGAHCRTGCPASIGSDRRAHASATRGASVTIGLVAQRAANAPRGAMRFRALATQVRTLGHDLGHSRAARATPQNALVRRPKVLFYALLQHLSVLMLFFKNAPPAPPKTPAKPPKSPSTTRAR